MDKSSLVGESTVGADQHVVRHRLPEHLHLQHIGQDLLGLSVKVGMDESAVVVAGDNVS